MIAELAIIAALAGQDLIHADVTGIRRWRVALEGPGGGIAFTPTAQDGDTREVVLMTTAWIVESPGDQTRLSQAYFVHTLDCRAWTQAQTGFGLTNPPPRRWTPMDGPPLSRPVSAREPIEPNTAMASIAAVVCRNAEMTLPEVAGEWGEAASTLRQRVEARLTPDPDGRDQ